IHLPPLPLSSTSLSFTDTATPATYPLSLHDALPILRRPARRGAALPRGGAGRRPAATPRCRPRLRAGQGRRRSALLHHEARQGRSEEHTSELQSLTNLVCRLLLEKKKATTAREHALH